MKKSIIVTTCGAALLSLLLTGCGNHDVIGAHYDFEYAMIRLPDGQVYEGKIDSWARSNDSDRVRLTIEGIDYVTQYSNVCLFSKKPDYMNEASE